MNDEIDSLAGSLIDTAREAHLLIACAESCTGGWIAKAITDQAGSSAVFDRGLVTYSNAAKQDLLGVPSDVLENDGAVSEATAMAMVNGLLISSAAQLVVVTTGIAGPGGGTDEKPVGTVWLGWAHRGGPVTVICKQYSGNREAVRLQTVKDALEALLSIAVSAE